MNTSICAQEMQTETLPGEGVMSGLAGSAAIAASKRWPQNGQKHSGVLVPRSFPMYRSLMQTPSPYRLTATTFAIAASDSRSLLTFSA